jgi:hypothetical protein
VFRGGTGSTINKGTIEDFDLFNRKGDYGTSIAGKLAYKPAFEDDTEMGVFFGRYELPSSQYWITGLDQRFGGGYVNWVRGGNRVISELYAFKSDVKGASPPGNSRFLAAYLQYERTFTDRFTSYARIEDSWDGDDSLIVNVFKSYRSKAFVAGIRWDFYKSHALTLELGKHQRLSDNYYQTALSWSAVIP